MIVKWVLDRLFALVGLLLTWPLFLIIALLIKIKMQGPVFMVYDCIGKDGRIFDYYKFRTTTVNAEGRYVEGESVVTSLGFFLRKTKLSELPTLWHIFIGQMSFIGPELYAPDMMPKLRQAGDEHLRLRPGLTGPSMLKYRRVEVFITEFICKAYSNADEILLAHPMIDFTKMSRSEVIDWYEDNVALQDKISINRHYYYKHSILDDLRMLWCYVFGAHMQYRDERI